MFAFRLLLAAATLLVLSACVTQQQATVAPPAARPVAAAPASPQGRFFNKTVLSGTTLDVEHFTALNPDCSPAGRITIRVTQEPVHGTAQVTDREIFPSYPPANPRSACNVRKVPGTAIDYTPAPGFTGSDFVAYDAFTADGHDISTKVAITVK